MSLSAVNLSAAGMGSIALLIDADNAPAARIDFIIAELATYGVVNIRRAYGNWQKPELASWQKILHDYAIQPVQHFDLVKGKNASDMALLIEAMDILYTKAVGTFCLVSSDCDFTPLVLRLRADGKQVIGFGGKNAAAPFVASCTRFLYLEERKAASSTVATPSARARAGGDALKQDTKLITMLRAAIEAHADDEGWAVLGGVGSHIANQGSFDQRNYGYARLGDLFAAIDLFELRKLPLAGGGSVLHVRRRS
jgi:uncharacterized LabA/DUF88 family protein